MIEFNGFENILKTLKEFFKDNEIFVFVSVEYFKYLEKPFKEISSYEQKLAIINNNNCYRWYGIPIIKEYTAKSLIAIRIDIDREAYILLFNHYEDFFIELARFFNNRATELKNKVDLLEINNRNLCTLAFTK